MAGCDRARFRSMATETHASVETKLIENTFPPPLKDRPSTTASIIRAARRAPLLRLLLLATLLLLRPGKVRGWVWVLGFGRVGRRPYPTKPTK